MPNKFRTGNPTLNERTTYSLEENVAKASQQLLEARYAPAPNRTLIAELTQKHRQALADLEEWNQALKDDGKSDRKKPTLQAGTDAASERRKEPQSSGSNEIEIQAPSADAAACPESHMSSAERRNESGSACTNEMEVQAQPEDGAAPPESPMSSAQPLQGPLSSSQNASSESSLEIPQSPPIQGASEQLAVQQPASQRTDPSLGQPGTGEAQPNPDAVVSSAGQANASLQNLVPANFVEISQLPNLPSLDEEEIDDEGASSDEEEAEEPEWPPADKNHPYWQLQQELEKSHEAEQKAHAEVLKAVEACQQGGPIAVLSDLNSNWLLVHREYEAKKKRAAQEEQRMREEALTEQDENETNETTEEDDSSVEERSQPRPAARFSFTVGGAPGKAGLFTPLEDVIRIGTEIEAFRFTSTEDGIIHLFGDSRYFGWNLRSLNRYSVLPTNLTGFGTTKDLFDQTLALLQKHVMLSKNESCLLTYWAIATWFADYLPSIPCLAISGPAGAADLLLRTLRAVCRRPMLLADLSPAILRVLPISEIMPTLLIRQPHLTRHIASFLDASDQPGYLFLNGGTLQPLYCPKCIYLGEQVKDQPIASNSIRVHVAGDSFRPLHGLPTEDDISYFQNRLLAYRLLWHDKVAASNFRVPGFRPELGAMAEVLGAAIVDDPALQRGIIDVLKDRDEQSRVDRASGLDGVVLRAVLSHCHQKDQQKLLVRDIATTVNGIYHDEGEPLRVSSEKVGHVLKHLGLFTGRLGNAGRGLVLDNPTRSRAHCLGHSYDVLDFENACQNCHELQAQESQEVV